MPLHPDRLLERREALGLTQKEVAQALGIRNYQQYAQWEKGRHLPGLKYVEPLAKLLNTTIDYLLGISDRPSAELWETDLTPDEQVFIWLMRNGRKSDAAVFALSGKLPADLPAPPQRLFIESGEQSSVPSPDQAAQRK